MYPNQGGQGGQGASGAGGGGQWPSQQSPGQQSNNPAQQQQQHPQQQQHAQWAAAPPAPPQYQAPPGQQQQQPSLNPMQNAGPPQQTGPGLLQPNPEQYRLPPPQQMQQMYPQPYQQMGYAPTQPAPRQRTAIACRYCRRRKIRCSGFDQSEDGRCSNCQRFSQECVFTPVSAQTQAFVPAHTVWRGQNPPPNTQLYGAYGQPLPQHGNRDGYQQQPQQQQQQQPGQYPPPPQGYQQQPMYPQEAGRKRGNDEPHTPTLPPPNPGQLHYADPSGGASTLYSTPYAYARAPRQAVKAPAQISVEAPLRTSADSNMLQALSKKIGS